MRIFIHHRLCGRIHESQDAFHATMFACIGILSLPIAPRATYRFRPGGPPEGERVALSMRSIVRAYLTTWGFLIAFALVFLGPRMLLENASPGSRSGAAVVLAAMLGVDLVGFAVGFAAMTSLFWMGAPQRSGRFGRVAGWLVASLALFLAQGVVAAFGVKGIFGG